jgi:hypothetical protein
MTDREPESIDDDEWKYEAFRMGRATRTVEVAAADGTSTIEEGTVHFELINEEDVWMWEEEDWLGHFVSPDGGVGFDGGVAVSFDRVGIVELPEPMTREEAHDWLDENPEAWRQHLDESIESDTTVADVLGDIR